MTLSAEDLDYFARLYARRFNAEILDYAEVYFRDGTPPAPARCAANAKRWVVEKPEAREVCGWLFWMGAEPCNFMAHHVVQERDGRLRDITPIRDRRALGFLRHLGNRDEFDRVVEQVGYDRIVYPPLPDEMPEGSGDDGETYAGRALLALRELDP